MPFAKKLMLASINRPAGRAYREKFGLRQPIHGFANLFKLYPPSVRSKFVTKPKSYVKKLQHLKIYVFVVTFKKLEIMPQIIIRRLLQKTGSDAFNNFFEWRWIRFVIWKIVIRMTYGD